LAEELTPMTVKRKKKRGKKRMSLWIQAALQKGKHKGALHKALHVPAGERIPKELLDKTALRKDHVGRMARMAQNLRKMHHS
jgi:hypothetical protein